VLSNRTAPAPALPTPPPSLLDAVGALVAALVGASLAGHAAGVEVPRGAVAELGTWALHQRARPACPAGAAVLSGSPGRPSSCPQHDGGRRRAVGEGRRR
jgi:hypothetical protein